MLLKWQLYLAKFDDVQYILNWKILSTLSYCSQLWPFLAIYSIKSSFFDEFVLKTQEISDRFFFFKFFLQNGKKL
jgi:hypothetical protein